MNFTDLTSVFSDFRYLHLLYKTEKHGNSKNLHTTRGKR